MAKKTRKPSKMYTLKWIGNNCYVYTWKYIKKDQREKKEQRFKWYSLGPYNQELLTQMESMTMEEKKRIEQEYVFKWYQREFIESRMIELSRDESFEEIINDIHEIPDEVLKEEISKELRKDLKSKAKIDCEKVFEDFTPETFNFFLQNGGSAKSLAEEKIQI